MKLKLLSLIGAALFIFTACNEVDIVDGRIPVEYLAQAQEIVGDYRGVMERAPVILSFSLDGDRLILSSDRDLIGEGCESQIGDLTKIRARKEEGKVVVEGAKFVFDPNLCSFDVEGEILRFGIHKGLDGVFVLDASILSHTDWDTDCRVECSHNPLDNSSRSRGYGCRNVCERRAQYTFLHGRFQKVD